jgi:hypothetical protein
VSFIDSTCQISFAPNFIEFFYSVVLKRHRDQKSPVVCKRSSLSVSVKMDGFEQHKEAASYLQSGFGNKLGWGSRSALIVIDVCRAYWSKDSPLDLLHNLEGAAAPDSMRRLVDAARAGNVPVIWAQVRYDKGKMIDGGV